MPRDPVCGVILDEKTARFRIKHEGETYFFLWHEMQEEIQKASKKIRKVNWNSSARIFVEGVDIKDE